MKPWLAGIFFCSFLGLSLIKQAQVASLSPSFVPERMIKLPNFQTAKKGLTANELERLELWESMLTGRSAPLSRWMKDQYRVLGLSHLFTPSGFHLSAVLTPFLRILPTKKAEVFLLILLSLALCFVPGFTALRRMSWIKTSQSYFSVKLGFLLGLLLDILLGSFQNSSLSFFYSFLFLGVVYSGLRGAFLIGGFFFAQAMIAFFQGAVLSPLLLIFSPILNFIFAISMPILFLLAIPLWNWQLQIGLMLLEGLQNLVQPCAWMIAKFPVMEVNIGLILLFLSIALGKTRTCIVLFLFLSSSANSDLEKDMVNKSHEFKPQGPVTKVIGDVVIYRDGRCRIKLVRGFWWEKCSPRRESRKKIKKLLHPS